MYRKKRINRKPPKLRNRLNGREKDWSTKQNQFEPSSCSTGIPAEVLRHRALAWLQSLPDVCFSGRAFAISNSFAARMEGCMSRLRCQRFVIARENTIMIRSSSDQPLKTDLRNRLPLFSVLCQLIYSTHRRSPWFDVKRSHLRPLSLSAVVSLITTTHQLHLDRYKQALHFPACQPSLHSIRETLTLGLLPEGQKQYSDQENETCGGYRPA
jgi:hypothetical protein